MKCESLIRSRMVEVDAGIKEYKRLPVPEPCGENGVLYEVKARRANQRNRTNDHDGQLTFMGVKTWYIESGSICVKQCLCEKHMRKAKREGMTCSQIN